MRFETRPDGHEVVYFRQSWVNTFYICNERGRLDALMEHDDDTNEMAALGTAMHAGIEVGITGADTSPEMVRKHAITELNDLHDLHHFEYDELDPVKAGRFIQQWSQQLRDVKEFQELREGQALVEQSFDILVDTRGDTEMHWEGTVDAVKLGRYLVDWKTSGRQFQRWEKQRWAVQPTMYAEAARQLGWVEGKVVDFRFIVFDRGSKPPQVVPVERGPEHTAWLTTQLWRVYDQNMNEPWPLNDQHAFCSKKWCPVWDSCKGLFVADDFKAR